VIDGSAARGGSGGACAAAVRAAVERGGGAWRVWDDGDASEARMKSFYELWKPQV
jgi:hypothetical protein